jgi:hypothetical protein
VTRSKRFANYFEFLPGGHWFMNVRLIAAASIVAALFASDAKAITSVKKINILHNQTASPFFTQNAIGGGFLPFTTAEATFTPQGTVQAGQVTSLTSNGHFEIEGNSTSAGGWTDGNGIPKGITLIFDTQFTIGIPGTPANYYLTNPGTSGNPLGNGLGIAQGAGNTSTIDSINQTQPVGACCESIAVSAMSVSGVSFSGSLEEPGFTFSPGTVGNFGPYVIQANDFVENGETVGLWSESGPIDPENPDRPTIGFGVPSDDPSEVGRGLGVVASNTSMENTFSNVSVTTNDVAHQTWFPRQIGAWTLTPQNAKVAIKGIGYEYDVDFTITPAVAGDFNKDGIVDAADYIVWRKGDPAADSNGDTVVDETDLEFWRTNFGNGAQGASAGLSGTAVPEPAALMLLVGSILTSFGWRCFRRTRR